MKKDLVRISIWVEKGIWDYIKKHSKKPSWLVRLGMTKEHDKLKKVVEAKKGV